MGDIDDRQAAWLARFERTVLCNPWVRKAPHAKQAEFLLTPEREALYGGAARGGKSISLLIGAAQDVDVPGYAALIFRRTLLEHSQPEGLVTESKEWWGDQLTFNHELMRWTFPSGATITFGYLSKPDDIYRYRGGAYQYIAWDELTDFDEYPYTFMFTRQSKPSTGPLSKVPLRVRCGSNPGGPGTAWVKKRFITTKDPSRRFVPAFLKDNPSVDEASYVDSISHVDEVTRRQYLHGDWEAQLGGRFQADWLRKSFTIDPSPVYGPQGGVVTLDALGNAEKAYRRDDCLCFQTCDPAATARDWAKKNHDPDYTSVCTWLVTPDGKLLWLDCQRVRLEVPDIVPYLEGVYEQWGPAYLAIEAFAANRAVAQIAMRTRMVVRMLNPKGRDKIVRATPLMALARTGRLYFFEYGPFDEARAELLTFKGDDTGHDDIVDAAAYAVECMTDGGSSWDGPAGGVMPFALG